MGLNREELSEKIGDLIKSGKEEETWDFKAKWYVKAEKSELVKDIICMANNPTPSDAYIIIGVDENTKKPLDDYCLENDPSRKSEEDLITSLSSDGVKFANNNIPEVRLETVQPLVCGFEVDVIIIKSTNRVPYYLTNVYKTGQKETGKIESNTIYVRRGPRNSKAGFPEIEALWKKRFGLSLSIMDRFKLLLSKKDEWERVEKRHPRVVEENGNECRDDIEEYVFVNKYNPDFYIADSLSVDDRRLPSYAFEVCHPRTRSYLVQLFFRDFKIYEFLSNSLDSGRMHFVWPNWESWGGPYREDCYAYFYFIVNDDNDIRYKLNNIFTDAANDFDHAVIYEHINEYIIYFNDEEEKKKFDLYLKDHSKEIIDNVDYSSLELQKDKVREGFRESGKIKDYEDFDYAVKMQSKTNLIEKSLVQKFHEWKRSKLSELYKLNFSKLLEKRDDWESDTCEYGQNFMNDYSYTDNTVESSVVCRHKISKEFMLKLDQEQVSKPVFLGVYLPAESKMILDNLICEPDIQKEGKYYRQQLQLFVFNSLKSRTIKVSQYRCVVDIENDSENWYFVWPKVDNSQGEFSYFYFFKNSEERKINAVLSSAHRKAIEKFYGDKIKRLGGDKENNPKDESVSKWIEDYRKSTKDFLERIDEWDRIFEKYVICFEDEEEKQEFDGYLKEKDILNQQIEKFYNENSEKYEEDFKKKFYRPEKQAYRPKHSFSSYKIDSGDVKYLVKKGLFAEEIAKIFNKWKKEKAQTRTI